MRKKVWLNQAAVHNDQLVLQGETTDEIGKLSPSGQMLVDSDELAFVYLAEEGDNYTYLYIPDFLWSEVKSSIDSNQEIFVHIGENKLLLTQIKEEIEYLVFNIEGNSNYGDNMVKKVESVFLSTKE